MGNMEGTIDDKSSIILIMTHWLKLFYINIIRGKVLRIMQPIPTIINSCETILWFWGVESLSCTNRWFGEI